MKVKTTFKQLNGHTNLSPPHFHYVRHSQHILVNESDAAVTECVIDEDMIFRLA
jgi:hypothetical protein